MKTQNQSKPQLKLNNLWIKCPACNNKLLLSDLLLTRVCPACNKRFLLYYKFTK